MNASQLRELNRNNPHRRGAMPDTPTTFTNYQKQILYGSLLGDGGTVYNKQFPGNNERYSEHHGIEQTEYLNWKIDQCFCRWIKEGQKHLFKETWKYHSGKYAGRSGSKS